MILRKKRRFDAARSSPEELKKRQPCQKYPEKFSWFVAGFSARKTKKATFSRGLSNSGSPTWTRTRDLRINSPSLYQLSYQGKEALL
jgi:hypothetical protein